MTREAIATTISALACAVVGGLLLTALTITPVPTVQLTWPTKTCVRVIPSSAGTCAERPAKYHVEWVARHHVAPSTN